MKREGVGGKPKTACYPAGDGIDDGCAVFSLLSLHYFFLIFFPPPPLTGFSLEVAVNRKNEITTCTQTF